MQGIGYVCIAPEPVARIDRGYAGICGPPEGRIDDTYEALSIPESRRGCRGRRCAVPAHGSKRPPRQVLCAGVGASSAALAASAGDDAAQPMTCAATACDERVAVSQL